MSLRHRHIGREWTSPPRALSRWLLTALLPLAAVLAACAPASPGPTNGEVVVFAASSLADAFGEMDAAFEKAYPGRTVVLNLGASSQLRTQLEQGAHADVFASADETQMALAQQAGLVAGEPRLFARNRLAIATARGGPVRVSSLADLAAQGVKVVFAQPRVPIGVYTNALLDRASADPAYGPDFRGRVERNVVSREDNVRQVLAKVQLGEADAAVVYTTDLTERVREQVAVVPIPNPLSQVTGYPLAVLRGQPSGAAEAFVAFVLSDAGQALLARWGFERVDGAAAAPA